MLTEHISSLLASERSERDTLRGNAIEISLYLFIYLFIYMVRRTSFFARASNYLTTVTNFCSEGKVMLYLSVVRYQVLLCLDTYYTDAIAINKL